MSAKNRFPIDIDNRESKKSVVQRFMTSESETMPEPQKSPEPEVKQPEYYDTPKRKTDEEENSGSIDEIEEIEEVTAEKARKPLKDSKVDDEPPEPKQKGKFNPFVMAKPKVKDADKKEKESEDGSHTEKSENYLPYVGESLASNKPSQFDKTTPRVQSEAVGEKNIVVEEIVKDIENIEDEIELSDELSQDEDYFEDNSGEKVIEFEIANETDEDSGEIEIVLDEADEISDTDDSADIDNALDVLSILRSSQEKVDELLEKNLTGSEIPEEAERVLGRAVIKKILRRAYDHDDQSISHYVEMLEKNDVKTRFYFKNTLEDAVVEEVEAALKRASDMCKCEKCFADICAITLNSLKPHYVTTAMDELYDRVAFSDFEKLMEITDEVLKAIDIIKNNPTHK